MLWLLYFGDDTDTQVLRKSDKISDFCLPVVSFEFAMAQASPSRVGAAVAEKLWKLFRLNPETTEIDCM